MSLTVESNYLDDRWRNCDLKEGSTTCLGAQGCRDETCDFP